MARERIVVGIVVVILVPRRVLAVADLANYRDEDGNDDDGGSQIPLP